MSETLAFGIFCLSCNTLDFDCDCDDDAKRKVKIVKDEDDDQEVAWELDLPVKVHNALLREGIHTMGQLRELLNRPPDTQDLYIYDIRNFGVKSVDQIKDQFRRWEEAR